jgi:hypothetical protein
VGQRKRSLNGTEVDYLAALNGKSMLFSATGNHLNHAASTLITVDAELLAALVTQT